MAWQGGRAEIIAATIGLGTVFCLFPNTSSKDRLVTAPALPARAGISSEVLETGTRLLSLTISKETLTELETHRHERGKAWERSAMCSFYDGRQLLGATACGLRVHGQSSRLRQSFARRRYRLLFRKKYGRGSVPASWLFTAAEGSPNIQGVVIVDEETSPRSYLAHVVSDGFGCAGPRTNLCSVMLNRVPIGTRCLIEYLDDRQLATNFGPRPFAALRFSEQYPCPLLLPRADNLLTLEGANRLTSVDELLRHVACTAHLGNTDSEQGIAIRFDGKTQSPLVYYRWDLDDSFIDIEGARLHRRPWQQEGLALIVKPRQDSNRLRLLNRLRREDPAFGRSFPHRYLNLLNRSSQRRSLLPALHALRHYYGDRVAWLADYVDHRREWLVEELAKVLGTGKAIELRFAAKAETDFVIDGTQVGPGSSWYVFPDTAVRIEVTAVHRWQHWLVNNEMHRGYPLHLRRQTNTEVGVVLSERDRHAR